MTQTLVEAVAAYPADDPDWQVADALNAPDASLPSKTINVSVADVRSILMTSGTWGGIVLAASDTTQTPQVRGLCITVRDAMTDLTSPLHVDAGHQRQHHVHDGRTARRILDHAGDTRCLACAQQGALILG